MHRTNLSALCNQWQWCLLLVLSIFFSLNLNAQQPSDSLPHNEKIAVVTQSTFPDSIFRFNAHKPIPKRAGLYSACLPGLGQAYNRQYWKVGLVYAGSAVITGFLISNYREFHKYRKVYIGMIDNNPETPDTYNNYTVEDVKYLQDSYRKYFEYSVLTAVVGYVINILDAFIAAHLKGFDMGKDISLQVTPQAGTHQALALHLGITLH